MNYFLAKTDPATYSLEDLEREKRTVWDGVHNAQAIKAIQAMQPGDEVLIYHSQAQAAIVGLARVLGAPRPDPNDAKSWVVELEFVRKLKEPITLQAIKASHQFDDWSLVRQGRLSTMAVPAAFIDWLREQKAL